MKNEIEDLKLQLNYVCYDKEILSKLNKVWEAFFKLEEKLIQAEQEQKQIIEK
jgi:hypothetical protein